MMRPVWPLVLALLVPIAAACGDDGPSSSATASPATTTATGTSSASPSPTRAAASLTPTASVNPGPSIQPLGFPIDPATRLGLVTGRVGARTIDWEAGPDALAYSRDDQPSGDPEAANSSGWNCRVHYEYEGRPAVDWYIPPGTPVFATMDGTATLYATTVANGFDYYSLPREPYLGNPDRSRADVRPFPGPSGGTGVHVEIDNGEFLTVSGHLDLQASTSAVPSNAYYTGYSAASLYEELFGDIVAGRGATPVAQWQVQRGDIIGYSGDSGYSEAAHLHYTIQRAGSDTLLCPTTEQGFDEGGWLLK